MYDDYWWKSPRDRISSMIHRLIAPPEWSDNSRDVSKHHMSRGNHVHRLKVTSCVDGMKPPEVQKHYEALGEILTGLSGVRPIYLSSSYSPSWGMVLAQKMVYRIGDSHVETELYDRSPSSNTLCVELTGEEFGPLEKILEAVKPWVRKRPKLETKQQVYTLISDRDGMTIRGIGKTKIDFESGNYEPSAVARYQHIMQCLTSKEPCGRFCLFDGPPGTGKSYLIRTLIANTDAVFVLVPSAMVGSLTGPSLLPTFMSIRTHGKPLVLVLEDADMALVSRKARAANATALAEVLNLGDGLIGEMLDLRILATTNAERIELDPAITRPGRMCTHLTLGPLPIEQLAAVYNRLSDSDRGAEMVTKAKATTLAEVYRLVRDSAWAPKEEKKVAGQYL